MPEMRFMTRENIAALVLALAVALIMSAFAGASSLTYPEFTVYYWLVAAGITMLAAGALIWPSKPG
jgi:hypothetical protein